MIRRCFSVFRGVGGQTQKNLSGLGVKDWRMYLEMRNVIKIPVSKLACIDNQIHAWMEALETQDAGFFAKHLAGSEHWMLYEEFGQCVRYLDIETSGLRAGRDDVTVVGVFDGRVFHSLVRDRGLSTQSLQRALDGCKLLVTFFGSVFDVPVLRRAFPNVDFDLPHFDLCFAARKLGLRGGLKVIEKMVGIERQADICRLDGLEAVRLWQRYQSLGDKEALERLVEYNRADTVNLERLARIVYAALVQSHHL